jgi:hypothetical protein
LNLSDKNKTDILTQLNNTLPNYFKLDQTKDKHLFPILKQNFETDITSYIITDDFIKNDINTRWFKYWYKYGETHYKILCYNTDDKIYYHYNAKLLNIINSENIKTISNRVHKTIWSETFDSTKIVKKDEDAFLNALEFKDADSKFLNDLNDVEKNAIIINSTISKIKDVLENYIKLKNPSFAFDDDFYFDTKMRSILQKYEKPSSSGGGNRKTKKLRRFREIPRVKKSQKKMKLARKMSVKKKMGK